jgi:hypothetical protein
MCFKLTYLCLFCSEVLVSSYQAQFFIQSMSLSSGGLFISLFLAFVFNSFQISRGLTYLSLISVVQRVKAVNRKTSAAGELRSLRMCDRFRHSLRQAPVLLLIAISLSSVLGALFTISTLTRISRQYDQCQSYISLWQFSRPRVVLREGFAKPGQCGFDRVRSIVAPSQKLNSIPEEIEMFSNLEVIDLTQNNIIKLPVSVTTLSKLKNIQLDGNPVDALLDWSNQGLSTFPGSFLSLMKNLKSLDLSHNHLTQVAKMNLLSVSSLNLSFNNFSVFPFSYDEDSQHLQSVDLSSNFISGIPTSFFQGLHMFNLVSLNLSSNNLSSIQYHWGLWSNKETGKELRLGDNPIERLNWDYTDNSSSKLVWFPKHFDEIANGITYFTATKQSLGIGNLPEEIGLMVNLDSLILNSGFLVFPTNLCQIRKLRVFDISGMVGVQGNFSEPKFAPQCFSIWNETLTILDFSLFETSFFLQTTNIRIEDAKNVEVFNTSYNHNYIHRDYRWIIPRLLKWPKLHTLDLRGTSWQDAIRAFTFPSTWGQEYCSYYDACSTLPLSPPESLKTVYLTGLKTCDNNDDCSTLRRREFNNTDYAMLTSNPSFLFAGMNCSFVDSEFLCSKN